MGDNVTRHHNFKTDYAYDNAVCECFFKYAKKEEFDRKSFANANEVRLATFEYIDGFYNLKRPHSHNDNLSPNEKEQMVLN